MIWIANKTSKGFIHFKRLLALILGAFLLVMCQGHTLANTWTELGPHWGGYLSGIVVDASGKWMLISSPGGGIWRFKLQGPINNKQWDFDGTANNGLYDLNIMDLEWDMSFPKDHIAYAITPTRIYKSTDMGSSWTNIFDGGVPARYSRAWRRAPDTVRAFSQMELSGKRALFFSYGCTGLWYSFDGGSSWNRALIDPQDPSNDDNCVNEMVVDKTSQRLLVGAWADHAGIPELPRLLRSKAPWSYNCDKSTACEEFEDANSGITQGNSVITALASSNSRLLAAISYDTGVEFYQSVNAGSSWQHKSQLTPYNPSGCMYNHMASGPLVFGGSDLFHGNVCPILVSLDEGGTWSYVNQQSITHMDVRDFHLPWQASTGKMWYVTDGSQTPQKIAYPFDNVVEHDWTEGNLPTNGKGVPIVDYVNASMMVGAAIGKLAIGERRILVGLWHNGGACSDDSGASWKPLKNTNPGGYSDGELSPAKMAPSDPERVYVRGPAPSLYRVDQFLTASSCSDWGAVKINPPGATQHIFDDVFAISPIDPDFIVTAGSHDEIYISYDGGKTWGAPIDLPSYPPPYAAAVLVVAIDKVKGAAELGGVYAGTRYRGLFYKPADSSTFQEAGLNNPAPKMILSIAVSGTSAESKVVWVGTTDGLYRQINSGAFVRVDGGDGIPYGDVEIDPQCSTRVYAAVGFGGDLGSSGLNRQGGVRYSTNGGKTWQWLTDRAVGALGRTSVSSVKVDYTDSRYVYATSSGRGLWRHNWGANLPACE